MNMLSNVAGYMFVQNLYIFYLKLFYIYIYIYIYFWIVLIDVLILHIIFLKIKKYIIMVTDDHKKGSTLEN